MNEFIQNEEKKLLESSFLKALPRYQMFEGKKISYINQDGELVIKEIELKSAELRISTEDIIKKRIFRIH
ncbi:MAG: hypothetical protein ACTSUK_07325 [Promethearchaeota archaeon]